MSLNILTASHVELKKKILDNGIKKHQSVIDDFKLSIQEMLSNDGIVKETIDLSQQEFNEELIQKAKELAAQVDFANEEMKLLYDMVPTIGEIHDTVQLGSVVATDREVFFVSVKIERFQVNGLNVFGLSTKSPLYKAMAGKKKGDIFLYINDLYIIQELF